MKNPNFESIYMKFVLSIQGTWVRSDMISECFLNALWMLEGNSQKVAAFADLYWSIITTRAPVRANNKWESLWNLMSDDFWGPTLSSLQNIIIPGDLCPSRHLVRVICWVDGIWLARSELTISSLGEVCMAISNWEIESWSENFAFLSPGKTSNKDFLSH